MDYGLIDEIKETSRNIIFHRKVVVKNRTEPTTHVNYT